MEVASQSNVPNIGGYCSALAEESVVAQPYPIRNIMATSPHTWQDFLPSSSHGTILDIRQISESAVQVPPGRLDGGRRLCCTRKVTWNFSVKQFSIKQ